MFSVETTEHLYANGMMGLFDAPSLKAIVSKPTHHTSTRVSGSRKRLGGRCRQEKQVCHSPHPCESSGHTSVDPSGGY